jgi:hypothetical protein
MLLALAGTGAPSSQGPTSSHSAGTRLSQRSPRVIAEAATNPIAATVGSTIRSLVAAAPP